MLASLVSATQQEVLPETAAASRRQVNVSANQESQVRQCPELFFQYKVRKLTVELLS